MENKRSTGVTIFAWLFIILAIFGLLSLMKSCVSATRVCAIDKGLVRTILSFLLSALSLVAGIFILGLKEWARKLVIILRAVAVIFVLVSWIPFLNIARSNEFNTVMKKSIESAKQTQRQDIEKLYKPEFQEEKIKQQDKALNMTASAMPIVLYSILFLTIGWNAIIIFFFTRPKVREQFKN